MVYDGQPMSAVGTRQARCTITVELAILGICALPSQVLGGSLAMITSNGFDV